MTIKKGDLVRIKGSTLRGGYMHSIKQGAVCVVVNPCNVLGNVDVRGPSKRGGYQVLQGVCQSHVKLAKQAMRAQA